MSQIIKVFSNEDSVNQAVKEMDGESIGDSKVKVEIAGQPKRPKGPQPEDECRYCGQKGHWY